MPLTAEYSIEKMQVRARKTGAINFLVAFLQSPVGGPWPRWGEYKGNGQVNIPHFFRKPTTEAIDSIEEGIGAGDRVLVYTAGLDDKSGQAYPEY